MMERAFMASCGPPAAPSLLSIPRALQAPSLPPSTWGEAITGYYTDSFNSTHGFLRTRDGIITPFDPPGFAGTFPLAINTAGAIRGYCANGLHGFLRNPGGTFTTFDVPSAGSTPKGTQAFAINPAGEITGFYFETIDTNTAFHGFLRIPWHEDEGEGSGGGD
jgi:hypothetical protein